MPPAPGNKEDLTSPANALHRLDWTLLAFLVEVEEPFYERDGAGYVSPIFAGMHTCTCTSHDEHRVPTSHLHGEAQQSIAAAKHVLRALILSFALTPVNLPRQRSAG